MSTPPRIRLYGFIAEKARTAVLLRHGPHGLWRMILWDLDKDRFVRGQWFKGTIYLSGCDLSPDGEYFVALLAKHWRWRREFSVWSSLSRPPFFTALALSVEKAYCPTGAMFFDEKLNDEDRWTCVRGFKFPPTLGRRLSTHDRRMAEWRTLRSRRAFCYADRSWHQSKSDSGWRLVFDDCGSSAVRLENDNGLSLRMSGVGWVDFDRNHDLLLSVQGCLYRLGHHALRLAEKERAPNWDALFRRARLIGDFTSDEFKPIAAPYVGLELHAGIGFLKQKMRFPAKPLDRIKKERQRSATRRRGFPKPR